MLTPSSASPHGGFVAVTSDDCKESDFQRRNPRKGPGCDAGLSSNAIPARLALLVDDATVMRMRAPGVVAFPLGGFECFLEHFQQKKCECCRDLRETDGSMDLLVTAIEWPQALRG